MMKQFLLLLVFFCTISVSRSVAFTIAKADSVVQGIVKDTSGHVLSGVSITLKGQPNISTQTDPNGRYILKVSSAAKLVFSMVGYETVETTIPLSRVLDIVMKETTSTLEDVVVTAFGGQSRKSDMIGSVVSVNPSQLKVPSSNLTTALAGRVAGMIAYQRSGEPGQDNADFFIRGVTTFGYKTSPLILIDGMELTTTDLARLQPEDILSFSIMKDATSTAVYGARGANGVILVTTKRGQVGKAKLSFRVENSWSMPTSNVEFADPVTYMKLSNEAILTRTPLDQLTENNELYSDEQIANTAIGADPLLYPANDWRELLFKKYALNQRYNLNVSGGGGVARYYVSGSLNQDNGMLKVDGKNNFNNNIDLKSYTLRSNVTLDLTKSTEMVVRLSGNFDDYNGPIDGGKEMYNKVVRSNPVRFPAYYTPTNEHAHVRHIMFGNYGEGAYTNPYADLVKGYKQYSRSLMLAQLELTQKLDMLTEGLSFRTMMNTNRSSYFDVSRFYNPYFYVMNGFDDVANRYMISNINEDTATEYLNYSEGAKLVSSTFYLEAMMNYNRMFADKHGLSGMLVYIMRNSINANAGDLQLSLPFRNLGLSGRATYNYDNRYFAEFNFGYNGSERFHEQKRFGFFPSAGVAWSISNERFFEPWKSVVSNLRLRATYGLIGNDAIGSDSDRFFYLSNVLMDDPNRGAVFGRDMTNSLAGVSVSRYSNPDITWEISTKRNLALEVGLLKKIDIQAEYFKEHRSNILMTRASIPVTMGLSAPIRANVGEASGEGFDVSVDYRETFYNNWWASFRGNFTYARSVYEVFEEPKYAEYYRYRAGNSIHQPYGYIAERLFVDDYEAENTPLQSFGQYGGGDIKYLDVNRDGRITEADLVPIGNPLIPEIVYGFGLSLGYKGLDASAFFQGLTNESFWINATTTSPFVNNTQLLKAYSESYWSEENQDIYALWPRLSSNVNANNVQASTWFLRDGSFLRLKQVEVGYTLPDRTLKRLGASGCRIYLNGTNLFTFSKFRMWDVEMGGEGLGYPLQKVFNVGLNLTFN